MTRYLPQLRGTPVPSSFFWAAGMALAVVAFTGHAPAEEPLRVRIDQLVAASQGVAPGPVASQPEVLRRVYLDLTGSIPSAAAARAYLADSDPDKLPKLVDRLLESPEYIRHMANVLDIMFMERRPDKHIPAAEWQKYLYESVATNKAFDQLAREILSADGADPAMRPAAKFMLDRDVESNTLTRDVGRVFFGRDLQCAQCHDHPLIDSYRQAEYYGIFAFLNRSYLFTDKEKKVFIAEKADGDVNFTSAFTKEQGKTGPQLPGGDEVSEPTFNKGEEYTIAPADNVRPVPKYSRRAKLAELATNRTNVAFNRNIANRLWGLVMGRGLAAPLDLNHADNPPVSPALLDLLANEMVVRNYDIKSMLRELALTQTYQRAVESSGARMAEQAAAAAAQLPTLEAEQQRLTEQFKTLQAAMGEADAAEKSAREAVAAVTDEVTKAAAVAGEAKKAADAAAMAFAEAQKMLAAKQDIGQALAAAATKAQQAVQKLPNEKELVQAAEKFQARANQLVTEIVAATKSVTDLAGPAKAAADALAAAEKISADANVRLASAQQHLQGARQKQQAAVRQYDAATAELRGIGQRLAFVKTLSEYATRATAVQAAQAELAASQTELASTRQIVERLAAEMPQRQAELAAVQKAQQEMTTSLAQLRQERTDKQTVATTFAEVVAQAEVAAGKLPADAELKQTVESVKVRAAAIGAELAEKDKLLAAREPELKALTEKLAAADQTLKTTQANLMAAQQKAPGLESQIAGIQGRLSAAQAAMVSAEAEVSQRWANAFLLMPLKAKTPEQLAWSTMQAAGVVDQYRVAAEAELNKTAPLDPNAPADPAKLAARARQIEQSVYDKLKGNVGVFVGLFSAGSGPAQGEYFATADQALFYSNGGTLFAWSAPAGENLAGRMVKLEQPAAVAEELYLSVLTRLPTPEEVNDVAQALAARPNEKGAVAQELVWGLLASAEFRFCN